jgi:hypothetical protein
VDGVAASTDDHLATGAEVPGAEIAAGASLSHPTTRPIRPGRRVRRVPLASERLWGRRPRSLWTISQETSLRA